MEEESVEVAIIGAGPAGMTAAIQLKRYGIPFVLLEKGRVGGLLWNANLVENYPGFPAGVSGPKLIGLIEKQMERIGIKVTYDEVVRVANKLNKKTYLINTKSKKYSTSHLIIASGTQPIPIPVPVPAEAQAKVFSDIYPLLDTYEKRVAIIGGGDAAFDYALNLVKKRNIVTILNRGAEVKCLGLLWDHVMAEPSIVYRAETPVSKVEFAEDAGRLRVQLDAGESLETDYLLFAIGRIPQMDFVPDGLVGQNLMGLYYIGDVKNGLYRQAAIAAGDGLRAAMQIYHSLKEGSI